MMPLKTAADLWQLLIGILIAVIFNGGLWIGIAIGTNRGYRRAPDKYKEEWRQAAYERDVAEELLKAEQRVSKRFEAALNALTAQAEPTVEPRLRVAR